MIDNYLYRNFLYCIKAYFEIVCIHRKCGLECLKKQQIILLVASEVAHWIEDLACMPGDLSLLSESYKLTEENQLLRLVL